MPLKDVFGDYIRVIRAAVDTVSSENATSLGANVSSSLQKMREVAVPSDKLDFAFNRAEAETKAFFLLAENRIGMPNQPVIDKRREEVVKVLDELEEVLSSSGTPERSQLQ